MKELNRLSIELIQINSEIAELHAKKKQIEADMKAVYSKILTVCSATGKTIDEFEEV